MPTYRRPRLRVTKKGVKVQAPYVRLGKKTGINISKRGISASHRSKYGSISTGRGISLPCCPCSAVMILPLVALGVVAWRRITT